MLDLMNLRSKGLMQLPEVENKRNDKFYEYISSFPFFPA